MYYIAYGSNLNLKKMKQRCPKAEPVFHLFGKKVNKLKNWKLVFNEYANIIQCKNSFVPIGLWNISQRQTPINNNNDKEEKIVLLGQVDIGVDNVLGKLDRNALAYEFPRHKPPIFLNSSIVVFIFYYKTVFSMLYLIL